MPSAWYRKGFLLFRATPLFFFSFFFLNWLVSTCNPGFPTLFTRLVRTVHLSAVDMVQVLEYGTSSDNHREIHAPPTTLSISMMKLTLLLNGLILRASYCYFGHICTIDSCLNGSVYGS